MLDSLKSMIAKFDDTAYLGELVGAVAARVAEEAETASDPAVKERREAVLEALCTAVDHLYVFGEDEDWPDWERVLDAVSEAPLETGKTVVSLALEAIESDSWRKALAPVDDEPTDFATIAASLHSALSRWDEAF